tara:strand:- start:165 stop:737 length:573 start_codon:yes stop_codon:yes gene_type:complete
MSNLIKKFFALLLIGFSLHLIIIYYIPSSIMNTYYIPNSIIPSSITKLIGINGEDQNMINNSFARDLPDSEFTEVVRPSADILYGGCIYDVTYFPLVIETEVPESYWSISFFSENTDNFSTINENVHNFGKLKMYLFGPNSIPTKVNNGFIIVSPSNKGVMLMRQFIGDGSNLDRLNEIQNSLDCRPEGS